MYRKVLSLETSDLTVKVPRRRCSVLGRLSSHRSVVLDLNVVIILTCNFTNSPVHCFLSTVPQVREFAESQKKYESGLACHFCDSVRVFTYYGDPWYVHFLRAVLTTYTSVKHALAPRKYL